MLIIKENKEFRSSTFDVREIDSEKKHYFSKES